MTQEEKSLYLLRKFLEETPKEEIDKMIGGVDQIGIEGPSVDEYLDGLSGNQKLTATLTARVEELTLERDYFKNQLSEKDNACEIRVKSLKEENARLTRENEELKTDLRRERRDAEVRIKTHESLMKEREQENARLTERLKEAEIILKAVNIIHTHNP